MATHAQKSLAGYNPQGRKESDMTEATQHALAHGGKYNYEDVLCSMVYNMALYIHRVQI